MFNFASLGVFTGTENGVRCKCENCNMSCMPPIFGSRKNVCVSPIVSY